MRTPNNQVTKLYLNIANFNIEIEQITNLRQKQYLEFENLLFQIKNNLGEFVVKKPNRIDLQIRLQSTNSALSKTKYAYNKIESFIHHFNYDYQNKIVNSYSNQSFTQLISLLNIAVDYLLMKNANGIYFHASSIIKNNQVILFIGPSGIGKSTISQLLSEKYSVFSDDLLILKYERNKIFSFQAPVINKVSNKVTKTNKNYEVNTIFLLEKNLKTYLTKIKKNQRLYSNLLKQVITYTGINKNHLKFLKSFMKNIDNIYLLKNNKQKKEVELIIQ